MTRFAHDNDDSDEKCKYAKRRWRFRPFVRTSFMITSFCSCISVLVWLLLRTRVEETQPSFINESQIVDKLSEGNLKSLDQEAKPALSEPGKCSNFQAKSELLSDLDKSLQVQLLYDTTVEPKFLNPPAPVFSTKEVMAKLCLQFRWYFCPDSTIRYKENNQPIPGFGPQYWTSKGRLIVAKIACARIYPAKNPNQGIARDANHRFVFAFQNDEQPWDQQGSALLPGMKYYPQLAYHVNGYPVAFAHMFEGLPRLLILLEVLPQDVPIMIARSSASESLVELFEELDLAPATRFVWWDRAASYSIGTLYMAGEMCFFDGKWKIHSESECSSRVFLPYSKIRQTFIPLVQNKLKGSEQKPLVIVMNRADATDRRLTNQQEVFEAVQQYYQGRAEVIEVVGTDHDIRDQFKLFLRAKVVVAPHGAGLSLCLLMDPRDSVVIEIGYDDEAGFPWPVQFFGALFAGASLTHFVSVGKGSYYGDITADVSDLLQLLKSTSFVNGI